MEAVVAKARELGALVQQSEAYVKFQAALKANEADTGLNELMQKLQFTQLAFQQAAQGETPDEAKLQELEAEYQQTVNQIMDNPNMQTYQTAAAEVDGMMNYVTAILRMCVEGQDPATCEPAPEGGCNCDCGSCGGCN